MDSFLITNNIHYTKKSKSFFVPTQTQRDQKSLKHPQFVFSQKNGVNFFPFNARPQSRKENQGLRAKIDSKMQKRGFYSKTFAALRLGDFALGFAPKY